MRTIEEGAAGTGSGARRMSGGRGLIAEPENFELVGRKRMESQ